MAARTIARRAVAGSGLALTTATLAIAPALPAHAADCTKTTEGYSGHTVKVCGTHARRTSRVLPSVQSNNAAQLPFTGADITLMGVAGVALLGGGTMLVVAGRRRRGATANS